VILNTRKKFVSTVALFVCFRCNLAAEYSSVGNTSPGSCYCNGSLSCYCLTV